MNKYKTSNGEKVNQGQIESRMRIAKRRILEIQIEKHGYNFCVECDRNSSNTRLDCAHTISILKAKAMGKTELCWDEENIKVKCRSCHAKQDKLNLKFTG